MSEESVSAQVDVEHFPVVKSPPFQVPEVISPVVGCMYKHRSSPLSPRASDRIRTTRGSLLKAKLGLATPPTVLNAIASG